MGENQNSVEMKGSEVPTDLQEVPEQGYGELLVDTIESGEDMQDEELSEPEILGESYEDKSTETPYGIESLAEDNDDFVVVGGTHYGVALFVLAVLMVVPVLCMVMQVPVLRRTGLTAPLLHVRHDVC